MISTHAAELFKATNDDEEETPLHILARNKSVTCDMIRLLVDAAPETILLESEVSTEHQQ